MIYRIETGILEVNTYIIQLEKASDAAVIVDPGGDADRIAQTVSEKRLAPLAVVLTHGHFDHILGLKDMLALYPEAAVAIHEADRLCLGDTSAQVHAEDTAQAGIRGAWCACLERLPEPDVLLHEGDTLNLLVPAGAAASLQQAAADWSVLSTPGHSPGSVCLYNAAQGLLISGDTELTCTAAVRKRFVKACSGCQSCPIRCACIPDTVRSGFRCLCRRFTAEAPSAFCLRVLTYVLNSVSEILNALSPIFSILRTRSI